MWLLKQEIAESIRHAVSRGFTISAAQQAEFAQRVTAAAGGIPRCMQIAGDVAEIRVEGILTEKPDFFAWFFGGSNCTYESIRAGLALAQSDPSIKRMAWKIRSPGGHIDGLFETLAAIQACTKPQTVSASMADSAAYAIAATAGKIEAITEASEFGSIGVAISFYIEEDCKVIDITSTDAPDKRPDPTTEQGRATIRKYLDALHELFAQAIAKGRNTDVKTVNSTFGRGAVLLAKDALSLKLIDSIAKPVVRQTEVSDAPEINDEDQDDGLNPDASRTATIAKQSPAGHAAQQSNNGAENQPTAKTEGHMDLATLKAQHPELVTQIENAAVSKERDRINAHLELGEACGAMQIAIGAIKEGAEMTQTMTAKYMAAGLNRNAQNARASDDNAVDAALGGAQNNPPSTAETKDLADIAVEAMQARRNGSVGADGNAGVFIAPIALERPKGLQSASSAR